MLISLLLVEKSLTPTIQKLFTIEFLKKFLNFFCKKENISTRIKVKKTKKVFEDFYFLYTKKFFFKKKEKFFFINGKVSLNNHPFRLIFLRNTFFSSIFVLKNYQKINLNSTKYIFVSNSFSCNILKKYLLTSKNIIFFNDQIIFFQKIKNYLNKKNVYFFLNKKSNFKNKKVTLIGKEQLLNIFFKEKDNLIILSNKDYYELSKKNIDLKNNIFFIFDVEIFCENGYCGGCFVSLDNKNYKLCKTNIVK